MINDWDFSRNNICPRSGRMKIAQQFTAGIRVVSRQEVREADG
jgi:hypothetical protein